MSLRGLLLLLCAWALAAVAQSFPVKPIRLVVGSVAGGGNDLVARMLALKLTEALGQQVVVDNRGGASTIIGTENLAKSAPDGYTMGFATSNLVVNPALFEKLPYDALRDLAPVVLAARGLYSIAVHPALPVKSVKEIGRAHV